MMKKLGMFIFGLLLLSNKIFANPENFDIFGVDEKTRQKIYTCCSKMFEQYLNESKKMNHLITEPSEKDMVHRLKFEERIIARIKQIDDFSDVKLSVIYYPIEQKIFGTLDIVKASDVDRMPGKKKLVRTIKIVPGKETKNLFRIWKEYDEKNLKLIRENKLDLKKTSCPTTHCTWGFDEEGIKNILPKLQEGVAKNKQELLNLIKHSADENVRGDAIFILANDNHHQEIAEFLINFTDDPSDLVRNNVMRVLGAIAAKHKVDNLKIERIIQALNYPYVTDRNKAAYVLLGIIKSDPGTHTQVINQAGQTLIELLKLKQPNNHDFAYHILKELSHKNYDEHDYISWSKWIKDKQNIKH
ncbi:HEAT repeat domain-containing protein [Legionella yabuuchiae]|uniref:HEAT repeat domain-containing protein n=1 Tax=Legionella yabuuchiae TaxID=376727 RepID=UPI001055C6FF|nr:HEAT repeat domain-containing protein [Legionella yabuuchiae]